MNRSVRINRREMVTGCLLVLLGLVMPLFLNVPNMRIYPELYRGLSTGEFFYIQSAAFRLVLMNALRCFPHYLGAFLIGDAIHIRVDGREVRLVKMIVVCTLIPLVYLAVGGLYQIRYDFGLPAILTIATLLILGRINFSLVNISKKTMMVVMMVIAFQWLDVIPALTRYSIGRGETSLDVKSAAIILGGAEWMSFTAMVFFILFFLMALLLCVLIMDQNQLMLVSAESRETEARLMETQMRVLESRTYMELQTLVHDLKSPLTSIQALVGAVKIINQDEVAERYLSKIESSVERMSAMISEILYGDYRREVAVGDLIDSLLSQISGSEYSHLVQAEDHTEGACISVNMVYFTRALINLLENAFYAVNAGDGQIALTAEPLARSGVPGVQFTVRDNGRGIPERDRDAVWESGYSTKGSLGLGLGFVKKVVEENGGEVILESTPGLGTAVYIWLPGDPPDHPTPSEGGESPC